MSQTDRVSQGFGAMNLDPEAAPFVPDPAAPNPAPETVLDDGTNLPHPPDGPEIFEDDGARGRRPQGNAPMETDNGEFVPVRHVVRSDGVVINGQSSRQAIIAAGAALAAATNARRMARENVTQSRRSGSVSFQAGSGESPRFREPRPVASWNKNWLNVVLSFA